jgi:hypothetical protein
MRKRTRELDSQQREDHPPASQVVDGAETQEARDFFEQLTLLRPEDWQNGWTSYGYRIEPVIDRRDGQHYVFKVNEPYDPDFVMRHWGSGKYLLVLNNPQGRTITGIGTIDSGRPAASGAATPAWRPPNAIRTPQHARKWKPRR